MQETNHSSIIIRHIDQLISHSRHVTLVPHKNPDADSLGSALAFGDYCAYKKIPYSLWCATLVHPRYHFLHGLHALTKMPHINSDVICVFDAGDAEFSALDDLKKQLYGTPKVINIDHHSSNSLFGNVNLVDTNMPSTTAVCFAFFQHLHIPIDHRTATSMLAGILTDTSSFSNPATSSTAFSMAHALMRKGAHFTSLHTNIERTQTFKGFALWGIALSRLYIAMPWHIAITFLTHADFQKNDATDDDFAGLSNFLNTVADCHATLVLRETQDGMIKGSLRTTRDDFDVSKFALALGGGGHKKAAGFTIQGRFIEKDGVWNVV